MRPVQATPLPHGRGRGTERARPCAEEEKEAEQEEAPFYSSERDEMNEKERKREIARARSLLGNNFHAR